VLLRLRGVPAACYGIVSLTGHSTATTNRHESSCVRVGSVMGVKSPF